MSTFLIGIRTTDFDAILEIPVEHKSWRLQSFTLREPDKMTPERRAIIEGFKASFVGGAVGYEPARQPERAGQMDLLLHTSTAGPLGGQEPHIDLLNFHWKVSDDAEKGTCMVRFIGSSTGAAASGTYSSVGRATEEDDKK